MLFMDRFRQSEYTGENRCTPPPCTAVNIAIAVGASVSTLSVLTISWAHSIVWR